MKLSVTEQVPQVDALAVICFEPEDSNPPSDATIAAQNGWLADLRSVGEFTGKLYESVTLYRPEGTPAKRLVAVGGGKASSFSQVEVRRLAGSLVRSLKPKGVKTVALSLESAHATPEIIAAAAEGAIIGAWEPDKYKTDPKKDDNRIEDFSVVVPKDKADYDRHPKYGTFNRCILGRNGRGANRRRDMRRR